MTIRLGRQVISDLCAASTNLHHAIVLFEEPLHHVLQARDAFFRDITELGIWLQARGSEYEQLGIPYATWVDGCFENHGINIED